MSIQIIVTGTKRVYHSNRVGSRAAATSKMDRFVIIVNGLKPLTIIAKRSILDVAAVLDTTPILFYFSVGSKRGN